MNQEVFDMIKRSRIQTYKHSPFFAHLVLRLNIKEFSKEMEEEGKGTMAVDTFNNLYYSPKWVKKLTEKQLIGVICHETLHLAFVHLVRINQRDMLIWNVATDIVINNLLVNNEFELPKEGLIPENNSIELKDEKGKLICAVKDIDKKSAEIVYDEIYNSLKKNKKAGSYIDSKRFDKHIISDKKELSPEKQKELDKNLKDWKHAVVSADAYARNIGKLPLGMDRYIGEMLDEKVNWKEVLYKYISNSIPSDFSWSRQSKASQSLGIYMPRMMREEIEVCAVIDTSGSIQQKELDEFTSEIIYLGKSFNHVKLRVITCDASVQDVYEIENGQIQKIRDLSIKGGGGTSFKVALEHIKEEFPSTKIVVYFTDGFGDVIDQSDYSFKLMWLLSEGGSDEIIGDNGEVVRL